MADESAIASETTGAAFEAVDFGVAVAAPSPSRSSRRKRDAIEKAENVLAKRSEELEA